MAYAASGDFTRTQQDGYEEWTLNAQTEIAFDDDNWILEDVLIDCNGYQFRTQTWNAPTFTIRNVGVTGQWPNDPDDGSSEWGMPFPVGTGGTATFENIYLGDGSTGDWTRKHQDDLETIQPTAFFSTDNHTGHAVYDGVYVSDWTDNAFYCGNQGSGGTHEWRNCYVRDTDVNAYRIASGDGEMYNCHCESLPHGGVTISSPGEANWHLEDCHIIGTPGLRHQADNTGTYTLVNTQYNDTNFSSSYIDADSASGTNPNPVVPDSCPTTAVEAASGSTSGGGGSSPGTYDSLNESFEHADINGTYQGDTSLFSTTTSRAADGSQSVTEISGSDGNAMIWREDMGVTAGETFTFKFYPTQTSSCDAGIVFGVQDGATGWDDYSGYFAFFDSQDNEIRIDRWEPGLTQAAANSASLSWPTNEWLTGEIDYRNSDSGTITFTVFNSNGSAIASTSITDTTYDGGYIGAYKWHADGNWYLDDLVVKEESTDPEPTGEVYESWEDGAASMDPYIGATSQYTVEDVSNDRDGSHALRADGTHGRLMNGDAAGPSRGESFAQSFFPATGEAAQARYMLYFGVQGDGTTNPNRYSIRVDHSNSRLGIGVYDGSEWDWVDQSFDPAGTDGQWNELHVDFGESASDTITARYEAPDGGTLTEVTRTETTYDSGGWGYAMWTDSSATVSGWADYLRDTTSDGGGTDPDPEPPAPPENLQSPSQTTSTIDLTWDHSPDYDSNS